MNPNTTIKTWLLACGKQFGIDQAHEYRWADAKTRPHVMYFTYQSVSGQSSQVGHNDLTAADGFDATVRGSKAHQHLYRVDLYNSQDGLYELQACCVAAQKSGVIKKIFTDGGCAFAGMQQATNQTFFDEERIDHHFSMIVAFNVNVEISLTEVNAVAETIDMQLNSDFGNTKIDDTGVHLEKDIAGGTGDLVLTGEATFVEA
jgi:hypothetical protein